MSYRSAGICLALTLFHGFAFGQTNTQLSGSYGLMIRESFITSENNKGQAILGLMTLDGAGSLSGTVIFQNGAGPRHGSETDVLPISGTYSTNPDGTGSIKVGIEGGFTLTFAMVVAESGQSLQFVGTDCTVGADSCGGPFDLLFTGAARATKGGASSLNGSYGFHTDSGPVPLTSVGDLKFDDSGAVTASFTSVGTSKDPSLKSPPMASGTLSGTYSITPDKPGTITFKDPSAPSASLTYAFVVTDGGSGLMLMRTEAGTQNSNVEFGSARIQ